MKSIKLFVLFVLSLLLVGTVSVLAADIDINGATSPAGDPSATVTVSFIAKNNNATEQKTFLFQSTRLTHMVSPQYTIAAPSISSITLSAGAQQTVTFNVNLPATLSGAYTATLNAQSASDATDTDTLTYTVIVNSVAKIDVTDGLEDAKLKVSAPEDTVTNKELTISNTGSMAYTPSIKVNGSFVDSDDNKVIFGDVSIGALNPGASKTITLPITIQNSIELGKYTGTMDLTTDSGLVTKSVPVEVNVEPEVCSDGRVSNGKSISGSDTGNIRVSVTNPDSGDDFNIGENIKVTVEVKNEDDKSLDIIVEAKLYDLTDDNEITTVESESQSVKAGKNKDFDLTIEVPKDSDLDEDNDYVLYVKAYDDGNEDEDCNYEAVDLSLKRNKYDVIIDQFTLSPSTVNCDATTTMKVGVTNVGTTTEDDVYVAVSNSELGLEQETSQFELGAYDEDDNSLIKTMSFKTPKNAEEKDYTVEARIYYNGGKNSRTEEATLKLKSCGASTPSQGGVSINTPRTSFTTPAGTVLTIPFAIKNNEDAAKTYTVEILATGWGESISQQANLAAGQEATTYAYVNVNSAAKGSNIAVINVKDNGVVVASRSLSVAVESPAGTTPAGGSTTGYQPTTTWGSFWRNLSNSTTLLILGVLILLALIIVLIVLLAR